MTTPAAESVVLDNLCDALARGRLCLAELALLDPPELEAMYEIAIGRLDTGRIGEAIVILQALVALYAYSARYWRGLGLALHLGRRLEAAMLAYQLALHLEPDHIPTVGLLGELKLFCGLQEEAYALLERAAHSTHPKASQRALRLLGTPIAPPLPDVHPVAETPRHSTTTDTFELTGGGPLPMHHTDTGSHTQTFPQVREVTNKIFLADHAHKLGHVTETAIIHRKSHLWAIAHEGSATDTGVVERADGGHAGQIGDAGWDFMRWFASAAQRRRSAAPLLAEEDEETTPMGDRRRRR